LCYHLREEEATAMCPNCWNRLTLCDECSRNAARYPEPSPSPFSLAGGTGYTMEARPGQYNVVIMPGSGVLRATGCTVMCTATGTLS
jgi:hypothetical protein